MKRRASMIVAILTLTFVGWFGIANAADIFMFVPGLQGDALDNRHKGWIDVQNVAWGIDLSNPSSAGAGAPRPQFQDVVIGKFLDSASPNLATVAASGQRFPSVVIEFWKSGGKLSQLFAKLELTDVGVTSYASSISAQPSPPVETIKLSYSRVVWSVIPQRPDGTLGAPIVGGWDLRANTKP